MSLSLHSQRLDQVKPQYFALLNDKLRALAASGADVIRLDIGSPDMPPPDHVLQALYHSANQPQNHGYQAHMATDELRSAWCLHYKQNYAVDLDPAAEVIPLMGSKEGIFHLLLAMVNPGDVVLIPDPGYLTYTQATLIAGGVPVSFKLDESQRYLPDFSAIPPDIARRAKLMWLNYPNNPTGASVELDLFTRAVEFAREHDILICHDAAYAQVVFDGYRAPSLLQVPGARQVAVEFNTLSKSHNMPGWRVGAALGNSQALRGLYVMKTHADSGHFLPILHAAAQALNSDSSWMSDRNAIYSSRRDRLVALLQRLGVPVTIPRASIYVWCRVPPAWSGEQFAAHLLEQAHVSLAPGAIFGQAGEGYVRIALTTPDDRFNEALHRLERCWGE